MKLKLATTLSLLTLLTLSTVTDANACRYHGVRQLSVATLTNRFEQKTCSASCSETHSQQSLQPDAARALAREGDKRVAVHDYAGAVADYTKATIANPTFARIYAPAEDNFLVTSNLEQLLADCNRVLLADPTNPYALAIRGEIKYNLGATRGAEADFRQALHYKDDLYFAHLRLAETNLFLHPENASTGDCDTALQYFPHSPRMHLNMGIALGRIGLGEMAAAEYGAANKLSPEWSRPYYMLAFADLERGDKQASMNDLSKCIKYEPNWAWAYVQRARLESKAGDYKAALSDMDRAIALEPNASWLVPCRAQLKISAGDSLGAFSDYIGLASRRSEIHVLLAMWFILAQLKFVRYGRETIRRRLLINE